MSVRYLGQGHVEIGRQEEDLEFNMRGKWEPV